MRLKPFNLLAVCCIVLAVATGCGNWEKIKELTAHAGDAMADKNYAEAIKDYSEAIRLNPKFESAYAARGDAYLIVGKSSEAIQDFNQSILLNPTNYLAYELRGAAYYGNQQFDQAISDLTFAIKGFTDDENLPKKIRANAFKLRGEAYHWKHDYPNAIADFNAALQLVTNVPEIYDHRGGVYLLENKLDLASNDFNTAIQLDPEDTFGLYNRGRLYTRTGSYTNAVQDFEKVIYLQPKAHDAYNMLGWVLATCPDAQIRDGKRAVELAKKACQLSKWEKYAYVDTLAAACAETGDFEQAVMYQKQALGMSILPESNRTNVQNRLNLYLQHKPYRKADNSID